METKNTKKVSEGVRMLKRKKGLFVSELQWKMNIDYVEALQLIEEAGKKYEVIKDETNYKILTNK